ncbi:maternal effect protein oskar isoform X2 [Eupeodes corollae]|uniref:maternal effect protein oskar isoform X2 n=1 Tax=Eupeodes corollae TaxID=290404 RepID=UPI002490CDDD|nr:maternal effect protein oskar isoform X2 [Eupeodes corollae]
MTIDANYYFDIREEYPNLESEIRGILMAHAQNGATIQQIRDDFLSLTGERFPVYEDVTDFLLTIPYVTAMCNENGTRIFNIMPSEKTRHVYDMVIGQKPPPYNKPPSYHSSFGPNSYNWNTNNNNLYSNRPSSVRTRSDKNSSRSESEGFYENINCFFEDNYQYLFNRFNNREDIANNLNNNNLKNINNNQQCPPVNSFTNNLNSNNDDGLFKKPLPKNRIYTSSQGPPSPTTTKSHHDQEWGLINDWSQDAHLFDFQLLGDDFMLYLARMELKCKFKPDEKVLQSGLCISGQTISAATKRISQLSYVNKRMIINIGSVDILQGKPLVKIQHDFLELLSVLRERGVMPIVTTLAPLALFGHVKSIKDRLERFNVFIKQRAPKVIDIWSCVVNEKSQTLFDCFQGLWSLTMSQQSTN